MVENNIEPSKLVMRSRGEPTNCERVKRTFFGLDQLGLGGDLFEYAICPEFFNPKRLSGLLRAGKRPVEVAWDRWSLASV